MTTLKPSQLTLFPPPTSGAEDSPASRSALPESAKDKTTAATSGPSGLISFAALDPSSSCWKTYQGCYQPMMDGSLVDYSETWPKRGMVSNGAAYRLQNVEQPTKESDCLFWPTAQAQDYRSGKTGTRSAKPTLQKWSFNLNEVVLWPTPATRDWKDSGTEPAAQQRNSPCLPASVQMQEPAKGSLNPDWVSQLMGFPDDWLDGLPAETKSKKSGKRRASQPANLTE
jgi:hypothetical protein